MNERHKNFDHIPAHSNSEVADYLTKFKACVEGYDWAVESCTNMQEVWNTCKPEWIIWLVTETDCCTERDQREFGLAAAQQVEHLITDQRSKDALKVKRRWLDGVATDEELETAKSAAWVAAWEKRAAWATRAEWLASRAAAGAAWAAELAAGVVAQAANASRAAAGAAWAAARDTQAKWIRDNLKPDFTRGAK